MSSVTGVNFVTFNCNGASVAVEFESAFKFEAGLKPDINSAKVPYQELDKLGGNYTTTGSLVFSSTSPGSAEVTIQNIYIVDLQPSRFDTVVGGTGPIVVEWTVHFADWRFGYVAPRGGRLRYGVMNPSNSQPPDPTDYPYGAGTPPNGIGTTPISLSELIQDCLDAMGSNAVINGDVSADPPRDLQWHGNHAPTELEKLLDIAGCVFCPHLDGSESIETLGKGTAPTIPAGQQIASVNCGSIDMRAKQVVICSAPTPVIITETIAGVTGTTGGTGNTWEYVVQDTDKTWVCVAASPSIFQDNDPIQLIVQGFTQITPPNKTLESQLYRCIRLNTSKYPPPLTPIMEQRFDYADGQTSGAATSVGRPQILANVAVLPPDSTDSTQATMPKNQMQVDCNVVLKSEDTILVSDIRLGKMSGDPQSRADYDNLFEELGQSDINVRISHESLDDVFQPLYYVSVWQSDGAGGASKVSSGTDLGSNGALNNPDPSTIFVFRPDFQAISVDGTVTNQSDLDSKAQAIAPNYLIDQSSQITETRAKGFVPASCNGLITKIEFEQKHPQTTFYLNHWYRPHTKHARHLRKREEKTHGVHEDYPRQHEQSAKRTGLGMSGASQPNLPHGSPGNDVPVGTIFVGKITKDGGQDGTLTTQCTWTYTLTSVDGATTIGTLLAYPTSIQKPRPAIGSMIPGSGFVFYILTGTAPKQKPLILDPGEVLNTGPCLT